MLRSASIIHPSQISFYSFLVFLILLYIYMYLTYCMNTFNFSLPTAQFHALIQYPDAITATTAKTVRREQSSRL